MPPAPWSVPPRVVGRDAPAELGEDHRHDLVLDPARGEVRLEGAQRAREHVELRIVRAELAAVGVERPPVDGDHARPQAGAEQRRRELQLARQVAVRRVPGARLDGAQPAEAVGDVDREPVDRACPGEPLVARARGDAGELADLRVGVGGDVRHGEARAAEVLDRAHGRARRADLLRQRGVQRDRLQRVDLRAVGVEPAAEPAGLHLLQRAGEPVVAAVEVRAVGRGVVGRREDREVRARAAAPVAVERVEALRVAVVAGAGHGRVGEGERAAGAAHRRSCRPVRPSTAR